MLATASCDLFAAQFTVTNDYLWLEKDKQFSLAKDVQRLKITKSSLYPNDKYYVIFSTKSSTHYGVGVCRINFVTG
jgi:hypothetical protein